MTELVLKAYNKDGEEFDIPKALKTALENVLEKKTHPNEDKLFTATDIADSYVEGFKDGFNTALSEGHTIKRDDIGGYV